MLKSEIADVNNAGEGGMAGAVTAALFLQKFVPDGLAWAHLDSFAWMPAAKPGRPKGGEALGPRAGWALLRRGFGRLSPADSPCRSLGSESLRDRGGTTGLVWGVAGSSEKENT